MSSIVLLIFVSHSDAVNEKKNSLDIATRYKYEGIFLKHEKKNTKCLMDNLVIK